MKQMKSIFIILLTILSSASYPEGVNDLIGNLFLGLNGTRDTIFEKNIKHIVNDYARLDIHYNDEKVMNSNGFVTKEIILKYKFPKSFIDSIKSGINSVILLENSEYFLSDSKYILTIGSIKSWYEILFDDLKEQIGYINYGNKVYKVYFNNSTISMIRDKVIGYISGNNRIKE